MKNENENEIMKISSHNLPSSSSHDDSKDDDDDQPSHDLPSSSRLPSSPSIHLSDGKL